MTIRPGTDLAFLGGVIHYILAQARYFEEYVVHYTNVATLLTLVYSFDGDQTGLFAGWNPANAQG